MITTTFTKRALACLGILLAGAACNDTIIQQQTEGVLSVVVSADGSMSGVATLAGVGACAGIELEIAGPSMVTDLVSGTDGAFGLGNLSAGVYQLSANAEGYETYEQQIVYDADGDLDLGTIELLLETVSLEGSVTIADGGNPAGTAVSVSSVVEVEAPAGLDCSAGDAQSEIMDERTVLTDSNGRYRTRVPRRSQHVRGRANRDGYWDARVEAEASELAAATRERPAAMPEAVLFPLTGFVNIADGRTVRNSSDVPLQVTILNDVSEMGLGEADATGLCVYGEWQTIDAAPVYTLEPGEGLHTICVRVRNADGQVLDGLTVDVELDTVSPLPVQVEVVGGGYVNSVAVTLDLDVVESGLVTMVVSNDTLFNEPVQTFSPQITHLLAPANGSKIVHVRFFDAAGNAADLSSAPFVLDTVAPTAPQFKTVSQTLDAKSVFVELFAGVVTDVNFAGLEAFGGLNYAGAFTLASADIGVTGLTFDLVPDVENLLQVRAVDLAGNASAAAQVVIVEDSTDPEALIDITVRNADSKISLEWPIAVDLDVVGYWVYYGTQSRTDEFGASISDPYIGNFSDQGVSPVWVAGRPSNSLTLSGVPNGTQIYATVVAADAADHRGEFGNEIVGNPNEVTPDYIFPPVSQGSLVLDLGLDYGLSRNGAYLYRSSGGEIRVFKITDAANPLEVSAVAHPLEGSVLTNSRMSNDRDQLYVVDYTPDSAGKLKPGLTVWDTSNAAEPQFVGRVSFSDTRAVLDIAPHGDRLYLSRVDLLNIQGDTHSLDVVAVTDPSTPVYLPQESEHSGGLRFSIIADNTNERLFVSELFIGMSQYDISGGAPIKTGMVDPSAGLFGDEGAIVVNGYVFVISDATTVKVFDASGTRPVDTGISYTASGQYFNRFSSSYAYDGDEVYTWAADGAARFDFGTTTAIAELSVLSQKFNDEFPNYSATKDGVYYHTEGGFQTIIDMTSGTASVIARTGISSQFLDLDIHNGLAAVAEGQAGVALYDYSGGTTSLVSRVTLPVAGVGAFANQVRWVIEGGHTTIHVVTEFPSTVWVVDADDPGNLTATQLLDGADDVTLFTGPAVSDQTAYYIGYSDTEADLLFVEVSLQDPQAPVVSAVCDITGDFEAVVQHVVVHDGRVLVFSQPEGESAPNPKITVYDPSPAGCPTLFFQTQHSANEVRDLTIVGDEILTVESDQARRLRIGGSPYIEEDGFITLGNNGGQGIDYAGGHFYVIIRDGVRVIDDSDGLGAVVGLGSDPFGGDIPEPVAVAVDGNWIVGLNETNGIALWQIATPTRFDQASVSTTEIEIGNSGHHDYDLIGPYMAIAGSVPLVGKALLLHDVRGSGEFERISTLFFEEGVVAIKALPEAGGQNEIFLVVTDDGRLYRTSISTPAAPVTAGWVQLDYAPEPDEMQVYGDLLYLFDNTAETPDTVDIYAIDSWPTLVSRVTLPFSFDHLVVGQGVLIGVPEQNGDPMRVYRIDGLDLEYVGGISPPGSGWIGNVAIYGRTMYASFFAGDFDFALRAYDLLPVYQGLPPDLLKVNENVLFQNSDAVHGSDLFTACCSWISVDQSGDAAPVFSQESFFVGDLKMRGAHLFGNSDTFGVLRYDVE